MVNDCHTCKHAGLRATEHPCCACLTPGLPGYPNWTPKSGATPEPRYEQRGWLVHVQTLWGSPCVEWRENAAIATAAGLKVEACYIRVEGP